MAAPALPVSFDPRAVRRRAGRAAFRPLGASSVPERSSRRRPLDASAFGGRLHRSFALDRVSADAARHRENRRDAGTFLGEERHWPSLRGARQRDARGGGHRGASDFGPLRFLLRLRAVRGAFPPLLRRRELCRSRAAARATEALRIFSFGRPSGLRPGSPGMLPARSGNWARSFGGRIESAFCRRSSKPSSCSTWRVSGDTSRRHWHPMEAEPLLRNARKLHATRSEIEAMLADSGFVPEAAVSGAAEDKRAATLVR